MAKKETKKIQVTQLRSTIGQKPIHKKTIRALGLKHIGHTKEFTATPQIMGMLSRVNHMVSWKEAD
jgi:large subunit ribosomal protein L30